MKTTVLMTVHDREPEVLLGTLRGLRRCGLQDVELIVVDDRSEMDYSWVRAYAGAFASFKWVKTGEYAGFRVNGYGNPAHAFNCGLDLATGDRIVLMSSDVIVTPGAVRSMEKFYDGESLYTPRVIDMDSAKEYVGQSRFFPMPWFLVAPTKACMEVGGWDEAYLDGLCFEDNDFVGRMALKLGRVRCDWLPVVYHQSHAQPAYDMHVEAVQEANDRNRALTKRKWGGVPFDGELTPFDVMRKPDPAGCQTFYMKDDGMLARVVGGALARV
jgi:hypothetical protein